MKSIAAEPTLDELYRMVSYIYVDKNTHRTSTATFAHFVEVCGMLTIHDRKKKREGLEVTDALCKALGWYFPLLAKMRVRSVEELVFRKFPGVCPYCRLAPHKEVDCKLVRGTNPTVNHQEVENFYKRNWTNRPKTLDGWQEMFQQIYPRSLEEHGRSTIGLLEELGELSEAVRVFERHPKYFLGEAADTFSYIMGIANEHTMRLAQEGLSFSFSKEFVARFPGLCIQCGSKTCVCPAVPEATVGRMAKELSIGEAELPFLNDVEEFTEQGKIVAHRVLESVGGLEGLTSKLPFDRGDANRALVSLCLKIADAVAESNPRVAERLRSEALSISVSAQLPGTPKQPIQLDGLLNQIQEIWRSLGSDSRSDIRGTDGLVGELGEILDTVRILFVYCTPADVDSLRVHGEYKILTDLTKSKERSFKLLLAPLPAATATDFRRALLDGKYDIIHFAGHSDSENLIFEDESGNSTPVPLKAIAEVIENQGSAKAVILNACGSVVSLTDTISPITIGMDDSIDDGAAIEFSRGFYDGLVRGRSIGDAYREGVSAVKMANYDSSQIRIMHRGAV
ncbi:CHAT domain-containing protein [Rhodopseudomonas parapalustris]